jgi:two-component sensor histidine kinase
MEAGDVVSLAMFLLSSGLILWITSRLRGALVAADSAGTKLDTALGLDDVGTWEVDLHTLRVRASGSTHGLHGIPDDGRERPAEEWQAAVHADDQDALRQALRDAEATGAPFAAEYRVPRPDGPDRRILSRGGVVSIGGRRRLVGTLIDITDRALVEERLRSQEAGLREALAERDMLVREADHRIKNSLQLVVSLLRLQRAQVAEPEAAEALGEAIGRVEAVAQSHKALQQSKDLRTVDFSDTLRDLCVSLGQLNPALEMRCGSESGLKLDAERAIPLALIVSELVTNALRHAYPDRKGQITVDAIAVGGMLVVNVADQGVGTAGDAGDSGLGSKVIRSLSKQIGAEVTLRSKPDEGTMVTVKTPHHATATAN